MPRNFRVLIGGLGDDAHSVGMRLLELGFKEHGFEVLSLGIRNTVEDFFKHAAAFDIILISNKNGHAELYLEDFAQRLNAFQLSCNEPKLWYLGGSLSVSQSDFHIKKKFLGMGFTNVYPKTVSFSTVLADIKVDLHRHSVPMKDIYDRNRRQSADLITPIAFNEVIDRRWTEEELLAQRKETLKEWSTGKHVVPVSETIFPKNGLAKVIWKNKVKYKMPLLQPRTGVADIDQQKSKLQFLENKGSDISSVQLDAASRSREYSKAEQGVVMSKERGTSQLNGFPLPVYGVENINKLICSLKTPFQLRGGGPDHKFTYEIALNAGISALEGGFLCYCLPYDKLTNPLDSLKNWQYIDRLCSYYQDNKDVMINREYFGVLTATLIEPSLAIIINIIQAISSAQQGIKSISVGYAEQGNRSQDIAAIRVLEESVKKYLKQNNYHNVQVSSVYHQFMAAFPSSKKMAEELIFNSTITATMARATKVMVKTDVESFKIPDRYDNARSLQVCINGVAAANDSKPDYKAIMKEERILRIEVKQIMDAIMELGNGSVLKGAMRGLNEGVIDIPWSPSVYNKNKVITVRDVNGAVRFYDFGNLPFKEEIKEFHKEKIFIRQNKERDSSVFSLLEKDLNRIWQNDYLKWPLDGHYVN
ncbi:MAG: methylaspartate mutase epsilon subunit [Cyclobacteriaceae bacterium]|jgi:methylaspartate mutase epsilon subunit